MKGRLEIRILLSNKTKQIALITKLRRIRVGKAMNVMVE